MADYVLLKQTLNKHHSDNRDRDAEKDCHSSKASLTARIIGNSLGAAGVAGVVSAGLYAAADTIAKNDFSLNLLKYNNDDKGMVLVPLFLGALGTAGIVAFYQAAKNAYRESKNVAKRCEKDGLEGTIGKSA